jgi:hypothetical protein
LSVRAISRHAPNITAQLMSDRSASRISTPCVSPLAWRISSDGEDGTAPPI